MWRHFNKLCARCYSHSALEEIKVLDLTRIVAGPFCTMILGDLGAKIIKVEIPGTGDECRNWPPNLNYNDKEMSCYFASLNRNKKSICINFKSKSGVQILYDLAEKCDVLVENFVPGKLDEMGLGYEELKVRAPHLIYCSLTGYGSRGPYKYKPGLDVIAGSFGGMLHITGPFDGEPCKPGVAMTDIATGLYAHGAILAALLNRAKTGKGQKIDCNLLSTQVACLINIGSNYLNLNIEGKRYGTAHESIVPYQSFQTSDGYITIAGVSNSQFISLCKRLKIEELIQDKRFINNSLRVKNRKLLIDLLKPHFLKRTTAQIMKLFEGAPFPFGPVNTISQGVRTIRLTLRKPKQAKQVKWSTETVDNEHLNRKKSKCCCIYEKPKNFGESSSESDDECENCFGHVELKKKNRKPDAGSPSSSDNGDNDHCGDSDGKEPSDHTDPAPSSTSVD